MTDVYGGRKPDLQSSVIEHTSIELESPTLETTPIIAGSSKDHVAASSRHGQVFEDQGTEEEQRPEYRVYKRRFFGLLQLVLLNIIVSWDVRLTPRILAKDELHTDLASQVAHICCRVRHSSRLLLRFSERYQLAFYWLPLCFRGSQPVSS